MYAENTQNSQNNSKVLNITPYPHVYAVHYF